MGGAGTLELSGSTPNTYTGETGVAGTVRLDFSNLPTATNLINPVSKLSLSGRLEVIGNPSPTQTTSQTFSSTEFNAGPSRIVVNPNGGAGTTLNLGRIEGFLAPTTTDITLVGLSAVVTTTTPIQPSWGWATMNGGQSWAVGTGQFADPRPVTPLSTFSSTFTSNANVDVPAGASVAPAGVAVSTVRFNAAGGAVTAGEGVQIGGILVTRPRWEPAPSRLTAAASPATTWA
jgi:autotransporter-associated beta strand protein